MNKNLQREFQKADSALEDCQKYFEYLARMNAKLHLSEEVYYSPLHARVVAVRAGLKILLPQEEEKA